MLIVIWQKEMIYSLLKGEPKMENLNRIMSARKISSRELAEMTGLPKQTIDAYRRRKSPRMPSFDAGMRIADALGVDPHELLDEREDHVS